MRQGFLVRVRFLSGVFILVAALLIVRLYFVQIVHGADYEKSAVAQYVEPSPDTENRGTIFFTTKSGDPVAAAVMQSGWRIAIHPDQIGDAVALYAILNAITPIDHDRFFTDAAKKNDPYEEIAFRVSDDAAAKIRA